MTTMVLFNFRIFQFHGILLTDGIEQQIRHQATPFILDYHCNITFSSFCQLLLVNYLQFLEQKGDGVIVFPEVIF